MLYRELELQAYTSLYDDSLTVDPPTQYSPSETRPQTFRLLAQTQTLIWRQSEPSELQPPLLSILLETVLSGILNAM